MKHTVDLLNEAFDLAKMVGFEVRREWLGEKVGGACRLGDRWILFSDLSLTAEDQLSQVIAALRDYPHLPQKFRASPQLRQLLELAD